MMSTAADKVGKLKNQHNVATYSGLAEQSYANVMHGGILLLVLLLLLAGSLPRAMELFRDWLKHSPGVRPAWMTLSEEAAGTAVMRIQSTCAQLGTDPAAHLSEFNVR